MAGVDFAADQAPDSFLQYHSDCGNDFHDSDAAQAAKGRRWLMETASRLLKGLRYDEF